METTRAQIIGEPGDGPSIALRSFRLPQPGLPRTWVMDSPFREVAPVVPIRSNASVTAIRTTTIGFWDNMPLEEIRTLPPPLYNTYRKDKPKKIERIEKSSLYEVGIMLFLTYLMILVAHVGMLVLANLNAAGQ